MAYQLAANLVLMAHMLFLAFVVLGGFLVFLRRFWLYIHLPSALWGAYVELSGNLCPLTRLENDLLHRAGASGYEESFISHYLLAVIYPEGLTREVQLWLGGAVLLINGAIYGAWLLHHSRRQT